jgi:acyl carrier protein
MKIDEKLFLKKIKELLEIEEELSLDMYFTDIDSLDSLSYMVISAWLFEDFGTTIPAMEIEDLKSLGGLLNFINK